jgi:hypothetical protein
MPILRESSGQAEYTTAKPRKGGPGAPILPCNRWLQEVLRSLPADAPYYWLYKPWLQRYGEMRGFAPADPWRSFRAAVAGCRKRIAYGIDQRK